MVQFCAENYCLLSSSSHDAPEQGNFIHVILSMGIFSNEVDLWSEGTSIADISYNAKLIPNQPSDQSPPTQADVDLVLFKYIDEQLLHLPVAMFTIQSICARCTIHFFIESNNDQQHSRHGYTRISLYNFVSSISRNRV